MDVERLDEEVAQPIAVGDPESHVIERFDPHRPRLPAAARRETAADRALPQAHDERLEAVFAQLVVKEDTRRVASDIVDVMKANT